VGGGGGGILMVHPFSPLKTQRTIYPPMTKYLIFVMSTPPYSHNFIREILVVILMFSGILPTCDMTFKIINKLKVNNDNFKFNDNFKSRIPIERTLKKHLL
jgi:hypothetical protein